jgi:5,10-methylenetetrahydromethanopterin reductase
MKLGAYFDGFAPMPELLSAVQAAEKAGAVSLWFAQHMGYRDAFISAAAAATCTRSSRLALTAISPYLCPPLPTAMSLASLAEIAPGRVVFSAAVGYILNLAQSGITPDKPIRVMREYVDAVRRLLKGEKVRMDGAIFSLDGAHMTFQHNVSIPVYIASTGPQMLRLAGEIGDGVVLSAGLTLAMTRQCLQHAQEGAQRAQRDFPRVGRCGFIIMIASDDEKGARAALIRKVGYLFRSKGHAANIASSGLPIDHAAVMEAFARHDFDGAIAMLPEETADAFGVAGTPRQCREKLEAYLATGVDEPVIPITGTPREQQLTFEILSQVSADRGSTS